MKRDSLPPVFNGQSQVFVRLRLVATILLLLALVFIGWEIFQIPWRDLQDYLPRSPLAAALILISIYLLKTVIIVIPLNALYVTASVLFPMQWAVLVSLMGLTAECSIGFAIGRYGHNGQIRARIEHYRFTRWLLELAEKQPMISCFIFRFMPPPADLSNMFFGATRLSYSRFILSSLAGFLPKLLVVIYAGEAALDAKPGPFIGMTALLLALELSPLAIAWLVTRHKERRGASQNPDL